MPVLQSQSQSHAMLRIRIATILATLLATILVLVSAAASTAFAAGTQVADASTGLYLKRIDVGADTITLGLNTDAQTLDLTSWTLRDNKDTPDHIYPIPTDTTLEPGGELLIDMGAADIGLGKSDTARVYNPSTTLVLSFTWEGDNGDAVYAINDEHTDMVLVEGQPADETDQNIIKDEATAVFLKRIDVGTDAVILGSKANSAVVLTGWTIKDDDDSHTYQIPDGTTIAAGGQWGTGTLPFGLGKSDKVRVYNASGTLILQFSWPGDGGDENAMVVGPWPGLLDVTPIDAYGSFGVVSQEGEHTDGNLSGLAYEPSTGTLWAADNDLNPTLGITGPKGPGSLNQFVKVNGSWRQNPENGWSFTLDGDEKGGKQLHFKDGTGGVDSEGVTLKDNDSSYGVFVSAERDNENKNVPRPSILRYKDTDGEGTGSDDTDNTDLALALSAEVAEPEELTATNEWNLVDQLADAGLTFAQGDDANLGAEGVAFVPDATLTDAKFTTRDGSLYDPADYSNSYGGLFVVAIEKNGHLYAFALSNADDSHEDTATLVQDINLPQEATAAGYSGARDLIWDAEHNQLLAQGDNDRGSAELATYTFVDGTFELTSLVETPEEIANANSEGFAITPDSECATVEGGRADTTYKPVYWSDDGATDGYSLRQGYIACSASADDNGSNDSSSPQSSHKTSLASTGSSIVPIAVLAVVVSILSVGALAIRRSHIASR